MFYFHREVLRGIDISHHTGVIPPFQQEFILWEVVLRQAIPDVLDMSDPRALSFFNIFPSMTLNPSQDYEHLKSKRADIQSSGYRGLKVPSSRAQRIGNLIVLFDDQSNNIQSIIPYRVEFRLLTSGGTPFVNHAQDILDFNAGEVKVTNTPLPPGTVSALYHYSWHRIPFNH